MSRYLFDEATHQRHPLKPMVFVISSIYKDVDIVDRCIVEHYISGKHADRAVFGEDIQPGELGERVFYIPKAKHKGKDLWKHPDLEPLNKYMLFLQEAFEGAPPSPLALWLFAYLFVCTYFREALSFGSLSLGIALFLVL